MKSVGVLLLGHILFVTASATAQLYDAVRDFSTNRNPNGVWRYGWSEGLSGPLQLFPRAYVPIVNNNLEEMWDDPENSNQFTPSIARNSGGDFDNGNVAYQAGALILHPGGIDGRAYAQIIWTAPKSGRCVLQGRFFAQQRNIDVDVHILVNGSPVFSKKILSLVQEAIFSRWVTLNAGDEIAFSVGPNGRFWIHPGNTGLEATIEFGVLPAFVRASEVEVSWSSRSNRLYRVDYRSEVSAGSWLPLLTNLAGNGQIICVYDKIAPGEPQRIYRVVELGE